MRARNLSHVATTMHRTAAALVLPVVLLVSIAVTLSAAGEPAQPQRVMALHSSGRPVASDDRPEPARDIVDATDRATLPSLVLSYGAAIAVGLVGGLAIGFWFEHRRRHEAEVEARRHLVALTHLDRRAVLGDLTASLTHELSQPLGAILRNAEAARMLLRSGPVAPEHLCEIVEDIRRDDKRATEIIRRMRNLLQKQELTAEAVDVIDVARDTIDLVAPAAGARDVQVELDPRSESAIVTGDRVHLQQVALNLVMNGLDAVGRDPSIDRRIVVRTMRTADRVEILVTDSGPGIAPDVLPRLFTPFFTTKAQGMGLGLSIANSIVAAHGGRIAAENADGRGAIFRVALPPRHPAKKKRRR